GMMKKSAAATWPLPTFEPRRRSPVAPRSASWLRIASPPLRSTIRRQLERDANSFSSASGFDRPSAVHHWFSGSFTAARPSGCSHLGSSGVAAFFGPFLSIPYWAAAGPAAAREATRPTMVAAVVSLRIRYPQGISDYVVLREPNPP